MISWVQIKVYYYVYYRRKNKATCIPALKLQHRFIFFSGYSMDEKLIFGQLMRWPGLISQKRQIC